MQNAEIAKLGCVYCSNVLGAYPGTAMVECSRCRTVNDISARWGDGSRSGDGAAYPLQWQHLPGAEHEAFGFQLEQGAGAGLKLSRRMFPPKHYLIWLSLVPLLLGAGVWQLMQGELSYLLAGLAIVYVALAAIFNRTTIGV